MANRISYYIPPGVSTIEHNLVEVKNLSTQYGIRVTVEVVDLPPSEKTLKECSFEELAAEIAERIHKAGGRVAPSSKPETSYAGEDEEILEWDHESSDCDLCEP